MKGGSQDIASLVGRINYLPVARPSNNSVVPMAETSRESVSQSSRSRRRGESLPLRWYPIATLSTSADSQIST